MPELPAVMAARFETQYLLPAYDATMMTQSLATARFFERATVRVGAANADKVGGNNLSHPAKLVANWIMGEVSRRLNAEGRDIDVAPFGAEALAALILRISDGTISNNAAKQVFDAMWKVQQVTELLAGRGGVDDFDQALAQVDAVIDSQGLKQVSDTGAIEAILDEVLAANQKSVDEYRAGKDKAFNALVGQAMKATKGKANPALVNELLKKKLG